MVLSSSSSSCPPPLPPALQDSPGQTWSWEEAVLAGSCERSCIWGLAQGSAEVSGSVRRSQQARVEEAWARGPPRRSQAANRPLI